MKKNIKSNLGYKSDDSDLGTNSTTAIKKQFETCTIEPKKQTLSIVAKADDQDVLDSDSEGEFDPKL